MSVNGTHIYIGVRTSEHVHLQNIVRVIISRRVRYMVYVAHMNKQMCMKFWPETLMERLTSGNKTYKK